MWAPFADGTESTISLSQLALAVVGSGGIGALLVKLATKIVDSRKDIEIRRLDQAAKQAEVEAARKLQENLEIKIATNQVYDRLKELTIKSEKASAKFEARYEAEYAEKVELRILLESAQKEINALRSQLGELKKAT